MKRVNKISKMVLNGGIALLFASSFYSCNKELAQENDTVNTEALSAKGFNFENKVDMNLSLAFKDEKANPNSNLTISLYYENPYSATGNFNTELTPIIKGGTNSEGVFSTLVSIPAHETKLYAVVSDYLRYNEVIEIPKATSYSNTIYPLGFGVLKNSSSTRGATDPVLYTRQSTTFNASYPAIAGNESNLYVLGTYNASTGAPDYLTTPKTIPSGLTSRLAAALPAGTNQLAINSATHYFDDPMKANVVITQPANVWVTYLSEGAWICNTVGYYYYPTGSAPASAANIAKRVIMFPNASQNGNGTGGTGGLTPGNTVILKYFNSVSGLWEDAFPSGYTVGWFLVNCGWSEGGAANLFTNVNKWMYSINGFNSGSQPQTIVLGDVTSTSLTMTFEDANISEGTGAAGKAASDKDFNDVCFMVTWNPLTAVDVNNYPKIDNDQDGDGVVDASDDYPTDPLRAYTNYYPSSSSFGTLAFEDNWPDEGDYDFNDMILDYQIKYITNAQNNVKDVELTAKLRAIGASNQNGFAWEFNGNPTNVASVTTTYTGPGTLLGGSVFPLSGNHTESGVTATTVIPFFDNAFTLFGSSYIANYPNTTSGGTVYAPVTMKKLVTFTTPVTVASLSTVPYNPFMVVNLERGREVHKSGKACTSKATQAYFGTLFDRTNQSSKWYVGPGNLPWVLDMPSSFRYPLAGHNIRNAYLKIAEWGNSAGATYSDWYSNTAAGYRDVARLK